MGQDVAVEQQWRELFIRHARVTEALERELQRAHNLSVTEMEALQRMAEHENDNGCRLQQLTEDVHMSQSALSRLVSRLEAQGLVCRTTCTDDRRGIFAKLTPEGEQRLADARPTKTRVLTEHLA